MTERPILFSGAMVRALLAGTKTQTRRIVKVQPWASCLIEEGMDGEPPFVYSALTGDGPGHDVHEVRSPCRCPYGQPGDRLWVREAIRLVPDQAPDDGTGRVDSIYAADGTLTVADAWPWRRSYLPPMHCPRGLSRITLEITEVRVERLQSISSEDCIAEGVSTTMREHDAECDLRDQYRALWEQINGAGSWDANSWVWAVSFRRLP